MQIIIKTTDDDPYGSKLILFQKNKNLDFIYFIGAGFLVFLKLGCLMSLQLSYRFIFI